MATGRRRAAAQSLQYPTGVAPLLCCCSGAKTQSLSALISQRLPEHVRESHLTPGMADCGAGAEARFLEGLEDDRAEIGAGQDFGGHYLGSGLPHSLRRCPNMRTCGAQLARDAARYIGDDRYASSG